ncbi:AMP-binding protein [Mycobacterium sherrisii]|uniref:AMP-binding protein n=1 Tax=Mycobacterium sherrisii TaxID=243061 RepID=UPI0039747F62
MAFNLADVFEAVADTIPEKRALTFEANHFTYREIDEQSTCAAHLLAAAGVQVGEHVALYLRNSVEHAVALLGLLKLRAVPVNVNYRYTAAELHYILVNADAVAVLCETLDDQERLAAVIDRLPKLRAVIVVGEHITDLLTATAAAAQVAVYAFDLSSHSGRRDFAARSGDDRFLLYTGGTTGYPKGVVWRHEDFFVRALSGGNPYGPARTSLGEIRTAAREFPPMTLLITAPLIHGAALYTLLGSWTQGARIVLMREFDADKLVRTIGEQRVNAVTIVGDAMGAPMADAMEKLCTEVDLSSLKSIASGGAVWSGAVRARLAAVKPDLVLRDSLGASESGNDGEIVIRPDGTLTMAPRPTIRVIDEQLREIPPGSDRLGSIARLGHVPLGYYKDPEKTVKTFPILPDGQRAAVLGDVGKVESDGTVVFLGRGSQCINTGGEKVYVEEVEACLHGYPDLADAVVVGVSDPTLGQTVCAVVQVRKGFTAPTLPQLQNHCRATLAGYKVPRQLVIVDAIKRTPAGKADYRWAQQLAATASHHAAQQIPTGMHTD